jgi:hypothetical protein
MGVWSVDDMSSAREQVILQTVATRQNAEKLLASLLRAQAECDQQLQKEQRSDAMKSVTGTSSLDRAIASTRRMLEQLDRSLELMTKDGGQEETPPPADPPAAAGALNGCDIRVVVGSARVGAR